MRTNNNQWLHSQLANKSIIILCILVSTRIRSDAGGFWKSLYTPKALTFLEAKAHFMETMKTHLAATHLPAQHLPSSLASKRTDATYRFFDRIVASIFSFNDRKLPRLGRLERYVMCYLRSSIHDNVQDLEIKAEAAKFVTECEKAAAQEYNKCKKQNSSEEVPERGNQIAAKLEKIREAHLATLCAEMEKFVNSKKSGLTGGRGGLATGEH